MNRLLAFGFASLFAISSPPALSARCIDGYQYLSKIGGAQGGPPPEGAEPPPRLSEVKAGNVARNLNGDLVVPYLKPRPAVVRPDPKGYRESPVDLVQIVVKFLDDSLATVTNGRLDLPLAESNLQLHAIQNLHPAFTFEQEIKSGNEWLTAARFCAASATGSDMADLTSFFSASLQEGQKAEAIALVEDLLTHPGVETAWIRSAARLPQVDIAPTTPLFDARQRYLDASPLGINLRGSWGTAGTKGAGLSYMDIEFEWAISHEDFLFIDTYDYTPSGGAFAHGNAVLGILSTGHNGYGVQGAIPQAQAYIMNNTSSPVNAVGSFLTVGDSVLIELEWASDPKGICSPSQRVAYERDDSIFAQLQIISANGLVVYEPAGNGAINLDHPCWGGEFTNAVRDSGAIVVAAGNVAPCGPSAAPTHTAATFSNFGTRVDANSWGLCVTTTGFNADLYDPLTPTDFKQHYTATFFGTSAATPIVLGAGTALQGWQKARTSRTFNPLTMRALLQRFGTASTGSLIAKQPDVGATLAWLSADDDSDGTANGDELSLAQDLIEHYYQAILGRASDAPGKILWMGEIERMRSFEIDPREAYRALAKHFFYSPEYAARGRLDAQFIDDLYQTFFHRTPVYSEVSYWTTELGAGQTRDGMVALFMFTTEFNTFMNLALTSNPQRKELSYIVDGYRAAFARLPESTGLLLYRGQLRTAICTSSGAVATLANGIATNFFASPEYAGRSRSDAGYISDIYEFVLGRGPDSSGLTYWVGLLGGGMTRATVLNGFFTTSEWLSRLAAISSEPCI